MRGMRISAPEFLPLDPSEADQARRLHALLQTFYRQEAEQLGLGADYPPLLRTAHALQGSGECWIAAAEQGELLAVLGFYPDEDDEAVTRIGALVVRPDRQRQGLATCLLHALMASVGGHARLTVQTAQANAAALAFYRQAGFKELRRWQERWPGGQLGLVKLLR